MVLITNKTNCVHVRQYSRAVNYIINILIKKKNNANIIHFFNLWESLHELYFFFYKSFTLRHWNSKEKQSRREKCNRFPCFFRVSLMFKFFRQLFHILHVLFSINIIFSASLKNLESFLFY